MKLLLSAAVAVGLGAAVLAWWTRPTVWTPGPLPPATRPQPPSGPLDAAALGSLQGEALERSRQLSEELGHKVDEAMAQLAEEWPQLAEREGVPSLGDAVAAAVFAWDSGDVDAFEAYYAIQGFAPPEPSSGMAMQLGFVSKAEALPEVELVGMRLAGVDISPNDRLQRGEGATYVQKGPANLRGPHDIGDVEAAKADVIEVVLLRCQVRFNDAESARAAGTVKLQFARRPDDGRWLMIRFTTVTTVGNGRMPRI